MFYIPIQKDFSKVKNKVAFGLTKRQIICFLMAAGAGIPTYLLLKDVVATDIAGLLMITVMLPFFLFALYEKEGQPLEQILKNYISEKYLHPQIRPVVNEPILLSVMQIADYVEDQERMKEEAKERSLQTRLQKIMKGGKEKSEETECERRKEEFVS